MYTQMGLILSEIDIIYTRVHIIMVSFFDLQFSFIELYLRTVLKSHRKRIKRSIMLGIGIF